MKFSSLLLASAFVTSSLAYDFSKLPSDDQSLLLEGNVAFSAQYDISKVSDVTRKALIPSILPTGNCTTQTKTNCDYGCDKCTKAGDVTTCTVANSWGITYDDGPSEHTPVLLDALKANNIKATFCVLGARVIDYPATLLRAYNEGHQICIHSWNHWSMTSMTAAQMLAELEYTRLAIYEVIGVSPTYFRPPYGEMDDRVRAVAAAMGLKPLLWNQDTDDFAELLNTNIVGNYTLWADNLSKASVLSLQHDIAAETVTKAIEGLNYLSTRSAKPNLMSAAACNGDPTPYKTNAGALVAPGTGTDATSKAAASATAAASTDKKSGDFKLAPAIGYAVAGLITAAYFFS